MAKGEAGLFVSYCAKDFLDGTNMLSPWEELAYRRICDMIYVTNDRLPDDDKKMAWATKTGRRWPEIKNALTTGERPKLLIVDGRITNLRCQQALEVARRNMQQKSLAGTESAKVGKSLKNLKRGVSDALGTGAQKVARYGGVTEAQDESGKPLKNNEPPRTSVALAVPNGVPNGAPNGFPNEPLNHQEDSESPSGASGAGAPSAPERDPAKELWDRGVEQLGKSSRSLIGKARRLHGDLVVMAAIIACEHAAPSEPVEFFVKCLEARKHSGNGTKQSPVEKLYAGALLAAEEWERRQRNSSDNIAFDVPLLDSRRPH